MRTLGPDLLMPFILNPMETSISVASFFSRLGRPRSSSIMATSSSISISDSM